MLHNHYYHAAFLEFDGQENRRAQTLVIDKESDKYNADMFVQMFQREIRLMETYFNSSCTKNLFYIMGGDFRWQDATYHFQNFDDFIKLLNSNPTFNKTYVARYSTPDEYIKATRGNCTEFPLGKNETDDQDMFVYSDGNSMAWSGFFSSRPNLKKQIVDLSNQFHAGSQLLGLQ